MNDLAATLDTIHAALLNGDIDQIAELTRQIEGLIAATKFEPEQKLEIIRAKAQRNAKALKAAMQGIRSAHRRLTELREAASGHRTYGRDGARANVANPFSTLKQRV